MFKLICFDLDNTLAPMNGPIQMSTIGYLNELTQKGIRLALISGKPTAYLSGMVRQTGLLNVLISGGNGECLYSSHEFPPRYAMELPIDERVSSFLKNLNRTLKLEFGSKIWIQPNDVQLCVFHYQVEDVRTQLRDRVYEEIEKSELKLEIHCYEHLDCIDILPKTLSKGEIVVRLLDKLKISTEETIAVGDSSNDVSMFARCGISIGICTSSTIDVTHRFGSIDSALAFISQIA